MYFKINKTGCQENKGLIEIRYDCYLSRTDAGNEEHYVTIPDYTGTKYEGKVDETGAPIDLKDYDAWVQGLPTITQNNPFVCHFRQFPETVTDEEILQRGEEILDMAMRNWQTRELHKNTNTPVARLPREVYQLTKGFREEIKAMEAAGVDLDFEGGKEGALALLTEASVVGDSEAAIMEVQAAYAKIEACEGRLVSILETDFTTLAAVEGRIRG